MEIILKLIEIHFNIKEIINKIIANIDLGDIAAVISAICAVISVISIYILIKERKEKNRPYLEISFELVRSDLACIVFINSGNVPLTIKSIKFDEKWIKQIQNEEIIKKLKTKENTKINIFPKRKWIVSFQKRICNIIDFENPTLFIECEYTKLNANKKYKETIELNFSNYDIFLTYISETDELRKSIVGLQKSIEKMSDNKQLNQEKMLTNDFKDAIIIPFKAIIHCFNILLCIKNVIQNLTNARQSIAL